MILHSRTDNEITLTLALSHRNGRGKFRSKEFLFFTLARRAGEGRVRAIVVNTLARLSKQER